MVLSIQGAYQIYVSFIVVVKTGQNFAKIGQNLVVSRHVGGQNAPNHPFSHLLKVFTTKGFEDVAIVVFEESKSYAAMVILQWRDIVVAYCKLRLKGKKLDFNKR